MSNGIVRWIQCSALTIAGLVNQVAQRVVRHSGDDDQYRDRGDITVGRTAQDLYKPRTNNGI